jgi:hypothetical protein
MHSLVRTPSDVERQDLHLDRQVNLAHLDVVWNLKDNWCKVQNALDARRYQTVANRLSGGRWGRDHTDRDLSFQAHGGDVVDVTDGNAPNRDSYEILVHVEQRGDREPAAGEPAVVGQSVTKVTDADDRDGVVAGEAEDALDVAHEDLDVVADAPRAVRADVAEVLAELRRVDARGVNVP